LATLYEPECEYVDGELIPKAIGTNDHSELQSRLAYLLYRYREANVCRVATEQLLRLRERVVLIPDLCLLAYDHGQHGLITKPPLLCIEILSPSDRFSYTLKKCDEYLRWGVPACWICEPEERKAWFYDVTGLHSMPADGVLRTGGIELAMANVWE
jgi:Uma2 family endonuclease